MNNKLNPAIVVVAYNRPKSLIRLLKSIEKACYSSQDISLIISIDFQDSLERKQVVSVADKFLWEYGKKYIINHSFNLGLKEHILSCGDLTNEYDSVIVLEDDLVVSPSFYNYARSAAEYYYTSKSIGGISLYSYEYEELGWFRFYPKNLGTDNFFMQWTASWGQLWTKKQWVSFKKWYSNDKDIDPINIPNQVKKWENSWKKYYNSYLVDTEKYFVYPYFSYTTLFDEGGVHYKKNSRQNHVSLFNGKKKINYNFSNVDNLDLYYDAFFQPTKKIIFVEKLGKEIELEFDFFGTKNASNITTKYVCSIKDSKKHLGSYSNRLIPYIENIYSNNSGVVFKIAKKDDFLFSNSSALNGKQLYIFRKIYSIREMFNIIIQRAVSKFIKLNG